MVPLSSVVCHPQMQAAFGILSELIGERGAGRERRALVSAQGGDGLWIGICHWSSFQRCFEEHSSFQIRGFSQFEWAKKCHPKVAGWWSWQKRWRSGRLGHPVWPSLA